MIHWIDNFGHLFAAEDSSEKVVVKSSNMISKSSTEELPQNGDSIIVNSMKSLTDSETMTNENIHSNNTADKDFMNSSEGKTDTDMYDKNINADGMNETSNSTNEQLPISNSTNEQLPISNSTNEQLPISNSGNQLTQNFSTLTVRQISDEEQNKLDRQEKRGRLSESQRNKLEQQAAINWDKFYKRNETRYVCTLLRD